MVGGNLLLLDEPTNDLDVNTLRIAGGRDTGFRRMRDGYQPRPFLPGPNLYASAGVFEGEGQVRWFVGNYRDYEDWRRREKGDASTNRRKRYRKLVSGCENEKSL